MEIAHGFKPPNKNAESIKDFIFSIYVLCYDVEDETFHGESDSMLSDLMVDLDDMPSPDTITQSRGYSSN